MSARVLVAGVGNVFFQDDGFGVEVARRLSAEGLPEGAAVMDVGIRGVHLAYRLLEAPDLLVVADLAQLGAAPGTLSLIEPCFDEGSASTSSAHALDLSSAFGMLRALGGSLPRVLLVGCEPALVEPGMGLSPPVAAAVEPAARRIRALVESELCRAPSGTHREVEPWTYER